MNHKEAVNYIHEHSIEHLEKASKRGYICPICGSGSGPSGTGIETKDNVHFTCFGRGSCFTSADLIDIIGQKYGLTNYMDKLKKACEEFGIELDNDEYTRYNMPKTYGQERQKQKTKTMKEESRIDYTPFFIGANKNIKLTTYHRGLSMDTLNKYHVGFVEKWKHPKVNANIPLRPYLIIPTSKYSYIARVTDGKEDDYKKMKVGNAIFNIDALETATQPIYVVEGELDALSIIDVGGTAIGLGSISMINAFLEATAKNKPGQPLIIALDNDGPGQTATDKLIKGLEAQEISFYRYNPTGTYKDANEALMHDKETLQNAVMLGENEESLKAMENQEQEKDKEEYLQNSTANYIQSFIDGITDSVDTPYIPTGFKNLDKKLDGGLYEGLYILGAISSLGKTTLVMQIADQVAQTGQDVLIFSLEMARTEIMAKSISRHTIIHALEKGTDTRNAKTTRGITVGSRYANYSKTETELINQSIQTYSTYADHIFISEGIGDIGVNEVRETVEKHLSFTGNKPVVIIDYIQLLAPYNDRSTDKQNTDKAVLELKRISRDFKIPVIGISSFNRANYSVPVTMEAFKESGAIEYSSDVLIGLQFVGQGTKEFDVNEAKMKNPRNIELKILKNRNGQTGYGLRFNYYPMFNYFTEV